MQSAFFLFDAESPGKCADIEYAWLQMMRLLPLLLLLQAEMNVSNLRLTNHTALF